MVRRCLVAAAVVALAATASSPSGAQERLTDETFAQQMFGANAPQQSKRYACFVRRFDAAHLAQNPSQKISVMKLLVRAERLPEDTALNYGFRVGVTFTDRPGVFSAGGDCSHARLEPNPDETAQLSCGVACGGDGVSVELSKDAKIAMVGLEGLSVSNNSDVEGVEIKGGATPFSLQRASLDECRSLIHDDDEQTAAPPS